MLQSAGNEGARSGESVTSQTNPEEIYFAPQLPCRCPLYPSCDLFRLVCSRHKFVHIVIYADHIEVRLSLEWASDIVDSMRAVFPKLDDSQNEILRFVEGIEDFVFCDCAR